MITRNCCADHVEITISPEIGVADAPAARDLLIQAVAEASTTRPARLELGEGTAAAPALQLAVAARRALEPRGAFAGYGPRAAARLEDSETGTVTP